MQNLANAPAKPLASPPLTNINQESPGLLLSMEFVVLVFLFVFFVVLFSAPQTRALFREGPQETGLASRKSTEADDVCDALDVAAWETKDKLVSMSGFCRQVEETGSFASWKEFASGVSGNALNTATAEAKGVSMSGFLSQQAACLNEHLSTADGGEHLSHFATEHLAQESDEGNLRRSDSAAARAIVDRISCQL